MAFKMRGILAEDTELLVVMRVVVAINKELPTNT
jgi:hypothetical protein